MRTDCPASEIRFALNSDSNRELQQVRGSLAIAKGFLTVELGCVALSMSAQPTGTDMRNHLEVVCELEILLQLCGDIGNGILDSSVRCAETGSRRQTLRRLADVLADIDRTNPVQIIAKVFSNIAVQHPLAEFVLSVNVVTEGISLSFLE